MKPVLVLGFALFLGGAFLSRSVAAADPTGVAFFEQKIRPVLVKHCFSCHGPEAKSIKGGLRLDSKSGMRTGGETGPAVVPGKIEESLILQALRHDGLAMPPTGKLSDEIIADFERWIRMGAPDPRDGANAPAKGGIDLEAGRKWWAFVPPRAPGRAGSVSDRSSWSRTWIDHHIDSAHRAKGIVPVADADRVTLIRRATLDLVGLPPTPEEVDAFVADSSGDAFAKVVDRLLASPHFGERWGRHWLDLARYADSNGKDENFVFHEAFRFRDYVVSSFNRDKPIDRFIREQLAGDLMAADNQQQRDEQLTGTGFLVIGPKVLADRDVVKRKMDVVDEQLDTIGRTFMALTLGCARCHDHKFDPVPTTDYYAMAGIVSSTRTLYGVKSNPVIADWMVRPLGGDGEKRYAAYKEHAKKLTSVADRIKKLKADLKGQEDKASMRLASKFVGIVVDDAAAKRVGYWKPSTYSRPYVGVGYIHDDKSDKGKKHVAFAPNLPKAGEYEVHVSYTAAKGRATNTPIAIRHADGETTVRINQEEAPRIDGLFRSVGKFRFAAGTSGSVTIGNAGTTGHVIVDAVRFVPQGALERDVEMAMGVATEVRDKLAAARSQLAKLETEEKKLKANAPPLPPLVLAVQDDDKIHNCRVNIRGNPHTLGPESPRGFITVASISPAGPIPDGQSGRLQLAQWLTKPDHPLTARVFVNRVWRHLFGEGLVRTVDNFGRQGELPSHPELLDALAVGFVNGGWSVKRLIRSIVLSRTYQLSAANHEQNAKVDPENRLHWRANRRRLEAEVIRDAMLATSGELDRTIGGPSTTGMGERAIDNDSKGSINVDKIRRRSLYLPIVRNEVPAVLEVFDFADPDVATGKRDATTVATQALFLMNSPFVVGQAQATARRLLELKTDDADRIADLYRRAVGRKPTRNEIDRVRAFVGGRIDAAKSKSNAALLEAWTSVCLSIFGYTEFRFVE